MEINFDWASIDSFFTDFGILLSIVRFGFCFCKFLYDSCLHCVFHRSTCSENKRNENILWLFVNSNIVIGYEMYERSLISAFQWLFQLRRTSHLPSALTHRNGTFTCDWQCEAFNEWIISAVLIWKLNRQKRLSYFCRNRILVRSLEIQNQNIEAIRMTNP